MEWSTIDYFYQFIVRNNEHGTVAEGADAEYQFPWYGIKAVTERVLWKKVFLKISKNFQ